MVVVQRRQQSCPGNFYGGSHQLPMGDDDLYVPSYPNSKSSHASFSRRPANPSVPLYLRSLTKWMMPITYALAVLSCMGAHRSNNFLVNASTGLDAEIKALSVEKEKTIKIVQDAKESKDSIQHQRNKMEKMKRLFQHEERMRQETVEWYQANQANDKNVTIDNIPNFVGTGTARAWVNQRQEALYHKIYSLQAFVREQSRQQVIEKYGPGPHRVQLEFKSSSGQKPGVMVIELAPLHLVPHSIEMFLDMVANGLWDNTVLYHHENQGHVIAAAPVTYGTFEAKQKHFDALGYNGLSFPEYSPEYGHKRFTIGFSGKGPNFYINTQDNDYHHGPGGQGHHELSTDADPCFGKVIAGAQYIKDMMPRKHKKNNKPETWKDFDLTQIVKVQRLPSQIDGQVTSLKHGGKVIKA